MSSFPYGYCFAERSAANNQNTCVISFTEILLFFLESLGQQHKHSKYVRRKSSHDVQHQRKRIPSFRWNGKEKWLHSSSRGEISHQKIAQIHGEH